MAVILPEPCGRACGVPARVRQAAARAATRSASVLQGTSTHNASCTRRSTIAITTASLEIKPVETTSFRRRRVFD
jgi:hypothetical protein